jgi:23S rRNA pseudouridine1911/1915/1917 synthase
MQFQTVTITADDNGKRLDQFLADFLGKSRSQVQKWIKDGHVLVDREPEKANFRLKIGQELGYRLPKVADSKLKGADIPLDIIFEDKNLLVINKPAGIVVHPDETGHQEGTIVHAVLAHCKDLSGIGGEKRPGIVHRLDKDTSGVLLIAKNDETHQHLSKLFHDRQVKKTYLALVRGLPKSKKGRIEAPISRHSINRKRMTVSSQGKNAITTFEVEAAYQGFTLLRVNIETGRTHQIRVHLASIGHPVIGDPVYGDKRLNEIFREKYGLKRQFLHAARIKIDGKIFEAPLPDELQRITEQNS